MMIINFKKPYFFEGNEYTSINIDLASLTGEMIIRAENNLRSGGDMSPVYEMSPRYALIV